MILRYAIASRANPDVAIQACCTMLLALRTGLSRNGPV
jgi:hypothetical protein